MIRLAVETAQRLYVRLYPSTPLKVREFTEQFLASREAKAFNDLTDADLTIYCAELKALVTPGAKP